MPARMLNERKKRNPFAIFGTVLFAVVLLCLLALLSFDVWVSQAHFVITVKGSSMENTLHNGDRLYVKYQKEVKRGDIVIINVADHAAFNQTEKTEYIVKRVIGLSGDNLYCENGIIYRKHDGESNYQPLQEAYCSSTTPDFSIVHVDEGEVFVLGDNRARSHDSQEDDVGCLKVDKIEGVIPEWAISIKGFSTVWEGFRSKLFA